MKLATRISSIRRSAWKTWRSCSPASAFDMARLVRQVGGLPDGSLARALEDARHRMLREPVDRRGLGAIAERAGDREIAPGVAKADR